VTPPGGGYLQIRSKSMSPGRGNGKTKKKRRVKGDLKDILLCNCVAGPETRDLSKGNGDQALWRSGDGQAYTITFDVSPFERGSRFTVKPHGTRSSGPIRKGAVYADYEYTVDGDGGCHQDPIIHIGP
jgi:hypothetical protein